VKPDNEKIYVSLGNNCDFALYLREVGKRKLAYPFDWLETSISMLPDLFFNRFKDFLKNVKTNERKTYYKPSYTPYFFDTKYKTFHWHDPSECDKKTREKYKRRCNRLIELMTTTDNEIIFVRIKSFQSGSTGKKLLTWINENENTNLELKEYKLNEKLNPDIKNDISALCKLSNVIKSEYENKNFKIIYCIPEKLYNLSDNLKIINYIQSDSNNNIEIKTYEKSKNYSNIL